MSAFLHEPIRHRERFARRFSWDTLARGLAHASDKIADAVRAPGLPVAHAVDVVEPLCEGVTDAE